MAAQSPPRRAGRTGIVLIHGLWMTPHSWRGWIDKFTAAGYPVHAPAWPGVCELDEELDHNRAPTDIGLTEVVDHYDRFIRALPEPPILMGHSFGGLITQILLDRGLGRAGVAIHPARPRGVFRLPLCTVRAAWPVLANPANVHRSVALSAHQFHYAFANTLSGKESDVWRAKLAIPAPGRPLFQAGFANYTPRSRAATVVDFANNDRAPLLLIAGDRDHIVPASQVFENFTRYRRSSAATDFKLFHGRPHLTAALDGWQDVAEYALRWTAQHTG
jgi:pimeloyl-ACP methyl ester carboxylesterase